MITSFKRSCFGGLFLTASLAAGLVLAPAALRADDPSAMPNETQGPFLKVGTSLDHHALTFLGVDSLGRGKVGHNVLAAEGNGVKPDPRWSVQPGATGIRLISSPGAAPFVLTIDTHQCYGTLLGVFDDAGAIRLPAVLHLPGFGTLRVTSRTPDGRVGYTSGPGWIKVAFPGASGGDYSLETTTIYPPVKGASDDARFDGFRRNWLNVLQLNPNRRILSNNTNSDSCGFCYYEYADVARLTPALANGLYALDIVRQSLESVFSGTKVYGMPGYSTGPGGFPEYSADTLPSLLIAAEDVVEGRQDWAWLRAHYAVLRGMTEQMLATDRNADGLVKYSATGNSGSWNEGMPMVRPSNWWDTIGFGYEDAYANALAYRALQGMQRMADKAQVPADAARYGAAAAKLHDAYYSVFLNPRTGLLAGWRSADGQLHDYAFTFVNSIAVLYGLVPSDKAAVTMDLLWEKMAEVGYTQFRMGLPGNLMSVRRSDYAHKELRWGGGAREDNADGFQIYENGGATACFTYFTVAAFEKVGQHRRSDQILIPMLDAFEHREFEGSGSNGMSNDWRKWDGTAEGYEGFLVDNYYVLLALAERR